MKIKRRYFVLLLLCLLAISFSSVNAQEIANPGPQIEGLTIVPNPGTKVFLVADVSVASFKIESQEGNNFKLVFDIHNGKGIQADIRYAISLMKKGDKNNFDPVDTKVFPEVLMVNQNEIINRTVEYNAPSFLAGEYQLKLEVQNGEGLPISSSSLEAVKLSGSGKFVQLSQCYLTLNTDTTQYDLASGVDVQDENLILSCNVKNGFDAKKTVIPVISSTYRSSFGKEINKKDLSSLDFESGKSMRQEFVIPKASTPQSYNGTLYVKDSTGDIISNSVSFHYVVHGESATIVNVTFDKNAYTKGDTAKLSFLWAPSADSFPNSRLGKTEVQGPVILFTVSDEKGLSCAAPFTQKLDAKKLVEDINVPMTANCFNPKVSIKIKNAAGAILAEKQLNLKSDEEKIGNINPIMPAKPVESKKNNYLLVIMVTLVAFLLSLVLILIYYKKVKKTDE